MRKKGFTLAEILITLGVVGVVSALTLPSMNQDITKQKIGPSLAKAVNTIEKANASLLKNTNARNLDDACFINKNTYSLNKEYLGCLIEKSDIYAAPLTGTEYSSKSPHPLNGDYNKCIKTKDGITFCTSDDKQPQKGSQSLKNYVGTSIPLVVDINGPDAKPNKYGRDAFLFLLDYSGQMIPFGGRLHRLYDGDNQSSPAWMSHCNRNKELKDINYIFCTGSIVDNNWKVIYNY